jgi:hypothetical protein
MQLADSSVHVIVVVPIGKNEPDGGEHDTVQGPFTVGAG